MLTQNLAAVTMAAILAAAPGLGARDEIRDQQWHLRFLNIDRAHNISTGQDVVVGVIDTGVDGRHPDLTGRLLPGADFSVEHLPNALIDVDGHGTAMAGLVAANGRALGIAPSATILPVRRSTFSSTSLSIDAAIDWAVAQGATVLCIATVYPEPDEGLREAIQRAVAHDVLVVAGVGNTPAEGLQYPAAFDGVVGAAGVDQSGDHAIISVVSSAADLAAPAVDIMTTYPQAVLPTGYGRGTGTSSATAIIAGVAALVRAKFPDLSAQEVIHRMTYTADDRGAPGRDDEYGYGIVNPVAALTADVPPLTRAAPPSHVDDDGTSTRVLIFVGALVAIAALLIAGLAIRRR